ncbi:integrase [Burkholderia vietnamiensis]|uniref:integrase n=1 Tax=Burkholderia vietnamiensis TaxID=60552 RepID=UPI000B1B0D8E|nr:integrase [Burkholderia vietnamiensis]
MSTYRYRQYRAALKAAPLKGKFMPYGWGALPQRLSGDWIAYAEMFNEFSQELANTINDLTRYTHQLTAWRDVVDKLDDEGKFNVAVEFVDPLATIALNLPYVIRSRFIFAAAHLSHQAGRTMVPKGWKDDLPLDDEIYFEQADAVGGQWKTYTKFKTKLERISDRAYQVKTKNFRNTYNHRFSPRVVLGQMNIVTRHVDAKTKQVSYGFGSTPPLTLRLVVELLEEQCQRCYKAFEAFQKLVQEHEKAISAASTATLAAITGPASSPSNVYPNE